MKYLTFLILLLLISSVSAFGNLETARIGQTIDLENPPDNFYKDITYSNPTDQNLTVRIVKGIFRNLDTFEEVDLGIYIPNKERILLPGERNTSRVFFDIPETGEYEGQIKVIFSKEDSKQEVSLNAVVQLNVIGEEDNTVRFIIVWVVVIIFVLLLVYLLINLIVEKEEKDDKDGVFNNTPNIYKA